MGRVVDIMVELIHRNHCHLRHLLDFVEAGVAVAIIAAAEVSRVGEQVEAVGKTGEVEANICRENEVEIGGVKDQSSRGKHFFFTEYEVSGIFFRDNGLIT
jgi:hypothetical protein